MNHKTVNFVDDSTNIISTHNAHEIKDYINKFYSLLEAVYNTNKLNGIHIPLHRQINESLSFPLISPRGPSTSLRLATHCATLLESVVRGSLSSSESSSSADIRRFSVRSTTCNKGEAPMTLASCFGVKIFLKVISIALCKRFSKVNFKIHFYINLLQLYVVIPN